MSLRISSTSISLGDKGLTLVGRSRAGDGTSFVVPELKWLFDCGALVHGQEPAHIFLTHTHADHVTFLTHYFQDEKKKPPSIYLSKEALPFIKAYIQAHRALTELTNDIANPIDMSCLHPVTPGEEFRIRSRGGDEYIVVPILADHRITCYGYSFSRMKKRLKDEFADLKGHEIGQLRKQGISIFETMREPAFCYIGDSTHRVFERNPEILQRHKVIVTECSFIGSKDVQRAQETQHTHWKYLKPIVESCPDTLFILIHFSLKHSALSLLEFFNEETAEHRNVHPMLVTHEMTTEWRRKKGNKGDKNAPTCQCFQCNSRV
mmetsp:Transcript_22193/g.28711  ORF Transcript_22193/g.28711 Transcript_22193/m.28711 type:complete len:320 (+) Transcript_22193:142-1101(+)